jgi:hypothetical protein
MRCDFRQSLVRFKRSSDASSNLSLVAPISSFNCARFVAGHARPISDENSSLLIFDSLSILVLSNLFLFETRANNSSNLQNKSFRMGDFFDFL